MISKSRLIDECEFDIESSNIFEQFDILIDSLNDEGNLTFTGQLAAEYQIRQHLKNNILIKGFANVENLKKNNQQAIFIGIHQSNWEVLVPMLDRLGLNIGGIYRHINNFFLDNLILKNCYLTEYRNQIILSCFRLGYGTFAADKV